MIRSLSRVLAIAAALAITGLCLPPPATATAALLAPEAMRVTNVTATQIAFHWSQNVGGAVGTVRNEVYRNGVKVGGGPLLSHTSSGLVPAQTYSFHVIAYDEAGNTSPPSRTLTVTTRGPGVVPPGPANLRVTRLDPTRVDLTFDQPDDNWDIYGYEIFDGTVSVSRTYGWFGQPTVLRGLRELAPESAHAYSVRALRQEFGASAPSNTVTVTTPRRTDLQAPSVPAGLTARRDAYACHSVRVTWTQSTDDTDPQPAIDYDIFVNGTREAWVRGVGSYIVFTVPMGASTIGVRAVDGSGNVSGTATATFTRPSTCVDS
ncbi:fibronectin type III domain-containing protein [Nonomuraea rubra]